jgi:hypothetical protein
VHETRNGRMAHGGTTPGKRSRPHHPFPDFSYQGRSKVYRSGDGLISLLVFGFDLPLQYTERKGTDFGAAACSPAARLQRRTRAARCAVHRLHTHALSPEREPAAELPAGAVLMQGGVFVVFRAACSRVSACNRRLRSLPRACCIRKPPRSAHPIPSLNGFLQP